MARRLAAILAADIAGFSALVGTDEEGTLDAQRRHRDELIDPLLKQFGGRIANTAGDSLLIEFPSAVEAVRMAMCLQEGMRERNASVTADRRIEYRVGVNHGDVVAEKQDLLGDGVNVAARLQALAPRGGIILSRSVRDQVRDRMKLKLADLGEVQVKNIARPVRAFQLLRDGEKPIVVTRQRSSRLRWLAVPVLVLVIVGVGAIWWQAQHPEFEPADPQAMAFALSREPSIAVLPFEDISDNPDAGYLSDGISESITSALTQSPDLMVIASDSANAFGDDPPPIKDIAEQLGVRYLLKGSVQTSGVRLRVTAQLLDAVAGRHLWSEAYDREVGDVFAIQDEISEQVLKELQVQLTFESGIESRRTSDLEEYLTYLRWRQQSTRFTPEANAEAFATARELLAERPDSAVANEMMGMNHYVRSLVGSEDRAQEYAAARDFYEKAIELDPEGANYQWLAWIDLREGRYEDAIRNADKGVAVAPNDPVRLRSAGAIKAMAGQPREGVELLRRAVRRTPIGSEWAIYELAYLLIMLGDYQEARELSLGLLAREVRDVRAHHYSLRNLAAMSVWEGDLEAARGYVERLLKMKPSASIEDAELLLRGHKNQEFAQKYLGALRKAGLPETAPESLSISSEN